ncbi:hypothetical protein [Psychroserpens damuponensis]|uniref:hypothetical protein n=1 Tax=Psychroserpens damuponensis TaxID=943936 RepID=UPI0012698E2D|nr:hypothetical protein [Psychroserpens damuponensis]
MIIGSLIGTYVAITPFLFYLYEYVPNTQVWETFLFTYDSNLWGDANLSMWILTGKAVPFVLLLIWFFTNRNWWYHALIVPIVMYAFQIVGLIYNDIANVDELDWLYMIPLMAIIIPSIYLIRAKMFNKINDADKSMQELEEEFMMKPKGVWSRIKQYF